MALLQECPPRWAEHLATVCGADAHLAPTSRNLPFPLDRLQASVASFNPDLLGSWEGGCNLTLARPITGAGAPIAVERRTLRLAGRPERRVMAFTRLSAGACIANLHASTARVSAEREVVEAARVAVGWAAGSPLILGGDLNIRPASSQATFDLLSSRYGFSGPTGGAGSTAIDHLLARGGLEPTEGPSPWPPELRELSDPTTSIASGPLPVRLSDHAPVLARFAANDPESRRAR